MSLVTKEYVKLATMSRLQGQLWRHVLTEIVGNKVALTLAWHNYHKPCLVFFTYFDVMSWQPSWLLRTWNFVLLDNDVGIWSKSFLAVSHSLLWAGCGTLHWNLCSVVWPSSSHRALCFFLSQKCLVVLSKKSIYPWENTSWIKQIIKRKKKKKISLENTFTSWWSFCITLPFWHAFSQVCQGVRGPPSRLPSRQESHGAACNISLLYQLVQYPCRWLSECHNVSSVCVLLKMVSISPQNTVRWLVDVHGPSFSDMTHQFWELWAIMHPKTFWGSENGCSIVSQLIIWIGTL